MKIVQLINCITAGGAERLVCDLHEEYQTMGHSSYIVSIREDKKPENLKNYYSLDCSSLYSIQAFSRLVELFKSPLFHDTDVVHVHLFPSLFIVPRALKKAGWNGKLLASEHSTFNRRRNKLWGRIADKFTYKPYEKIICVSSAVKYALDSWQPALKSKTIVIQNGARLELFSPVERVDFHKPVSILSVGRLTPAKNYFKALEAVARMSKQNKIEFVWSIAGEGKLKDDLLKKVEELHLSSKVKFLGSRNDIPELLKNADIFFIPSTWEGFGIAAVEAMAAGLPVVASDVPGLRDVIGKEAGILINPENIESMTNGLSSFLTNQRKAFQVGVNGPKQALQFSLKKCASTHLKLYTEASIL